MAERAHTHLDLGSGASSGRRSSDSFRKLDPRIQVKNPVMFIVEVGSLLTTVIFVQELVGRTRASAVHRTGRLLAVVHGALRQLRRGDGGGPRQGAGRHAAQDADGDRRERACATAAARRSVPASSAAQGRRRHASRPASSFPADGEIIEGVAVGRRVGDHGRVGAGHPRVRRRPLGGHRRHARAVGLDHACASRPIQATPSSTG